MVVPAALPVEEDADTIGNKNPAGARLMPSGPFDFFRAGEFLDIDKSRMTTESDNVEY